MKAFPTGVVRHVAFGNRPVISTSLGASFVQNNPWVAGLVVADFWSALQPTFAGALDYSYLDGAVTYAKDNNIPIILGVKTGGGANTAIPSWITGTPFSRPINTLAAEPNTWSWDDVLMSVWLDTCRLLGARYNKEPLVRGWYVSGPNSQYPEMFFKDDVSWATAPVGQSTCPAFSIQNYIDSWTRVLSYMAGCFPDTPLVSLLDTVPDPSGAGTLDGVFGWDGAALSDVGVTQYIDARPGLVAQCFVGTANMGDTPDMTNAKYQRLRKVPLRPSNQTPLGSRLSEVFYEIGNDKLSAVAGDLYEALRRSRIDCGAQAAMVSKTTWDTAARYPVEARNASLDFWGI